jgi:hypothetical protein
MTESLLLAVIMAVLMTFISFKALLTGSLRLALVPSPIRRAEQPLAYWFWMIAFTGATAVAWYYAALAVLMLVSRS